MPGPLTHWHILIETARDSQVAASASGPLMTDATALRRRAHGWSSPPQTTPTGAIWDTGPLPEVDFRFPGSDISSMAFLGALAPDAMDYHRRYLPEKLTDARLRASKAGPPETRYPPQWSELFHREHSGDLLLHLLEQVALVPSPALRSQALAFTLGYISHIAADIALNPWIQILATRLPLRRTSGPHCSFELLLDEYLAATYFEHARYSLVRQLWDGYIAPAMRNLNQPETPTAQLLHLLASAAEVYQLEEAQLATLPEDFLAGLQGLRHFLSGSGRARWLTLQTARKRVQPDDIRTLVDPAPGDVEMISLEQILAYATRLSVLFCRLAINYYTALRNTSTEASERSSQRAALVTNLRNWDLHTGYVSEVVGASSPALHNWAHFSDLWAKPLPGQEQLARLISHIDP